MQNEKKNLKFHGGGITNLFCTLILLISLLFSVINVTGAWFTDSSNATKTINAYIKTAEANINVYQEDNSGKQTKIEKSSNINLTLNSGSKVNNKMLTSENNLKLLLKNEDLGISFGIKFKVCIYATSPTGKVLLNTTLNGMTTPTSSVNGFKLGDDGWYYYQNNIGQNVVLEPASSFSVPSSIYMMQSFSIDFSNTISLLGGNSIYMELLVEKADLPQYTLTFDANGGEVTVNNKQIEYASNYGELPTPTMAGYTFAGWRTENLINMPDRSMYNIVIIKDNNITVNKTTESASYVVYGIPNLKPNTTYTISCNFEGEFTGRIYAFLGQNAGSSKGSGSVHMSDIVDGYFENTYTTYPAGTDKPGVDKNTGVDTDKCRIVIFQNNSSNSVNINLISDTLVISNICLAEHVNYNSLVTVSANHKLVASWIKN